MADLTTKRLLAVIACALCLIAARPLVSYALAQSAVCGAYDNPCYVVSMPNNPVYVTSGPADPVYITAPASEPIFVQILR
jgi:hypothetical protein